MAVSCPEVMYGAYYPYLYGRAGPSRPFYQYERFNQDLYSSSGVPLASSSTSAGSHSPCSPLLPSTSSLASNPIQSTSSNLSVAPSLGGNHTRPITKEEDLSATRSDTEGALSGAHNESSCSSDPESNHGEHSSEASRAQYLSATCVVFTNYSGDVAAVVDEHFTRALNFSEKDSKESSSPMSQRNFPPSFWDSNYQPPTPAHPQVSDLYSSDGGYADPWVPHAAHYGSYAHAAHAHAAHAYHHNMAQYGSLLRLPQQYGHSSSFTNRLHHEQQTAAHAFESAAAYSSYPSMAGLEAQEPSKDLYWF